jgi:hypothetical protein
MISVWSPDTFSDPIEKDRAVAFTSRVLERLRVATTQSITGQLLASADLDVTADVMAHRLSYHLTAHVLAERLASHTESATDRVPATWWDHWKHTHPWLHQASLRLMWSGAGWHHPRFGRALTRWCWIRPPDYQARTLTVTWTDWQTFPRSTIPVDDSDFGPPVALRTSSRDYTGSWPA